MKLGTCGNCGGSVTTPHLWNGIHPPTPTCVNCGSVPVEAHGPALPMKSKHDSGVFPMDAKGDVQREN